MDAVAAGSPPAIDAPAPQVFRCSRCGIVSSERTGFIIPDKHGKGPRDTRCVACEAERHQHGLASGIGSMLGVMAAPLFVYVAFNRGLVGLTLPMILASLLFLPLAIVMHELGHAITARLCGLEVGAIVIGQGRRLWGFEMFGIPVRIQAWPLGGHVILGVSDLGMRWLRARLWLAVLMGPAMDMLIIAMLVIGWPWFASVLGVPLVSVWIILHGLLLLVNLLPRTVNEMGRLILTDGLLLLRIPRYTKDDLRPYLIAVPWARSLISFEDEDYEASSADAERGLERMPDSTYFRVTLSACACRLERFSNAIALLRPMLDDCSEPWVHATVRNNLAVALLLSADSGQRAAAVEEAERLSAISFAMYPFILNFRGTRSLVLTAAGRPHEALAILEYRHYASAPRNEKSYQHAARAFAFQALGRMDEARASTLAAVKAHPKTADLLPRLGLPLPS